MDDKCAKGKAFFVVTELLHTVRHYKRGGKLVKGRNIRWEKEFVL